MLRDGFTMDDMLEQMKAVKKMGGMKGILGMLPGGQRALNRLDLDEKVFDRNEAIILSMTAEERRLHHHAPASRPHRPRLRPMPTT